MRYLALLALLAFSGSAEAGNYLIVCNGSCTAPDGTAQPSGTALNRILWDGVSPYAPPSGTSVIADDGRAVYTAAVTPTSADPLTMFNRLTPAEQLAVVNSTVPAVMVFRAQFFAATQINVGDTLVQAGFAALVSNGILTQARATQIANLAVASP